MEHEAVSYSQGSAPLLGGFWLLLTTTVISGYWSHPPSASEIEKLIAVFAKTLQYSYLFGILPALMLGAVDDILFHAKRIVPVIRTLIVGVIAFIATEFVYGSRGRTAERPSSSCTAWWASSPE